MYQKSKGKCIKGKWYTIICYVLIVFLISWLEGAAWHYWLRPRGRGGCEPVQVVFGGDLGVCCCSAQAPSQSATAPGSIRCNRKLFERKIQWEREGRATMPGFIHRLFGRDHNQDCEKLSGGETTITKAGNLAPPQLHFMLLVVWSTDTPSRSCHAMSTSTFSVVVCVCVRVREREKERTQEQIDDSASVEDWLSKSDQLNRVNAKHCKNYKWKNGVR